MNLELVDLIPIAVYVIMGLAMYRMASTNGISKPWLAWIPLGSCYVMGAVAEKCDADLYKKGRSYRKILLGLAIAIAGASVILVVLLFVLLVALLSVVGLNSDSLLAMSEESAMEWVEGLINDSQLVERVGDTVMEMMPLVLAVLVIGLAVAVISIVYQVYYFIAMSHIFARYAPAHTTMFTALGVVGTLFLPTIGSLTVPIFMLCLAYAKKPEPTAENFCGGDYWVPNVDPVSPQSESAQTAEHVSPENATEEAVYSDSADATDEKRDADAPPRDLQE